MAAGSRDLNPPHLEAWYFGRSATALTLIVALAIAGFAFAVRENQWLPRFAVD